MPTVRDALLWGAASLPLVALALVPRRNQLSKLQGELASLSRHSAEQHRILRQELAEMRRAHREALFSTTATSDSLESGLSAVARAQAETSKTQETAMIKFRNDLAAIAQADKLETAERKKLDQRISAVLEETRDHLAASTR